MARYLTPLVLGIGAFVFGLAGTAMSASNIVPGSNVTRYVTAITANTLKPSECAGITLTTVVAGVTGTNGADLLLGTSGIDAMNGKNGADCILGGGGDDVIKGGGGADVCIGGPGIDTFVNCTTVYQ